MAKKLRILVVHGDGSALASCRDQLELVGAESVPRAQALLRKEKFDGIFADVRDLTLLRQAGTILQADRLLEMLPVGVAIVDTDLRITWANQEFERWCGGAIEGKLFYEALGSPEILGPDYSPFHHSESQGPIRTRLHSPTGRYLELQVIPAKTLQGTVSHYVALGRDITLEHQQQQKLDAIHRAGRELADLDSKELAAMGVEERLALLKSKVLKYTHDLLDYHVIEIRLLDPATGRLEALALEGITDEAFKRVLYARATGNGITGLVAVTGKSYLCQDTSADPLYLVGAAGAKSSLTVPLIHQDKVIGTFNVESERPNAFTEQDQQFLEIFSREIADALHTLELLVAEKRSTATQSVDAIRREVAIPVDEILTSATWLLDRYIGHDEEMAQRLKHILRNARQTKQSVENVGERIAPALAAESEGEERHPWLRGMRILLADNDERVRRSAHGLLGRFGCIVETARDGKEALVMARLSQSQYDAILADIRLPDLNGYEVFQRVRQIQPKAGVVLMSAFGYDPSHSIIKAKQEGALAGVLYKPFRVDQLIEVLEKLPRPPAEGLDSEVAESNAPSDRTPVAVGS